MPDLCRRMRSKLMQCMWQVSPGMGLMCQGEERTKEIIIGSSFAGSRKSAFAVTVRPSALTMAGSWYFLDENYLGDCDIVTCLTFQGSALWWPLCGEQNASRWWNTIDLCEKDILRIDSTVKHSHSHNLEGHTRLCGGTDKQKTRKQYFNLTDNT